MASIRRKLEKKGVIAMTLLTLVLIGTACEDRIDNPAVNPSEGKMVEVALNIGFANEIDGYSLATKSGASSDKGAFSNELQPSTITKGDASVKPDQLYNLEIQQYDQSGKHIGGMESEKVTDHGIGTTLNVSLQEKSDCQLVVVAWGSENKERLGTGNLESAQAKSLEASTISSLKPDVQGDMNKMPYVLHLKHVKVDKGGIIQSFDGQDARLLLKRLATRLTIHWKYNVENYTLTQIILQSIPLNYKVIAAPDENNKYPSEMDQYTNIQLTEQDIKGKDNYSCWIPANVRGTNNASNSPLYRIKANAPTGSAYATFIAAKDGELKTKFNYRVYLGGNEYSDFNLYENTDYSYTVNFNHTGIPKDDRRVTYIDPIPASENNENFVNTANCFMVAPGGAFCFNPYKYYIGGDVTDNKLLQGWCKESKIQSVKVLWQTLENGDIGDPVLGTVNASNDHANIVDIKYGNDFNTARIYCRVAPNTTGGSGAIAAYSGENGTGEILWSWHIWVTDYSPDATGNTEISTPNKRKQKYTYGIGAGNDQLPMMDRNLGAMAGYITVPESELERSKTNGFHYQWGRKDPFRSSYSNKKIPSIIVEDIDKPTVGLLSLYKEDGITFFPMEITSNKTDYQTAYRHPQNIYKDKTTGNDGKRTWITSINEEYKKSWNNDNKKGVHDPCPAGWWVASKTNYQPLFTNTSYNSLNLKNLNISEDGGVLVSYDTEGNSCTYLKFTGYWVYFNQFGGIGSNALFWNRERDTNDNGSNGFHFRFDLNATTGSLTPKISSTGWEQEALLIRCIQEKAN